MPGAGLPRFRRPAKTNARVADLPEDSDLRQGAIDFNRYYTDFLGMVNRAFNGEPGLLIEAVGDMFRIKEMCYQLMRQPIKPGGGLNAAPTFEIPAPD